MPLFTQIVYGTNYLLNKENLFYDDKYKCITIIQYGRNCRTYLNCNCDFCWLNITLGAGRSSGGDVHVTILCAGLGYGCLIIY